MLQEGKGEESSKEKVFICPILATRPVTLDDSFKRMVGATVPNAWSTSFRGSDGVGPKLRTRGQAHGDVLILPLVPGWRNW